MTGDEKKDDSIITDEMQKFISFVENMSVIELSKFVKILEDRLGVSASMPISTSSVSSENKDTSTKEEEVEKTSFDIILKSFGNAKIAVIKSIRTITGLGLADSKKLVESAPKTIKEGVSKEETEKIKNELEAAGATIEVK
jgi:large subunit ribosomal protein L7/L12